MPTVLRVAGFSLMIYTRDHAPRHVHVFRAGKEVVINVDAIAVQDLRYMPAPDVRRALKIVADNQAFLQSEWERIKPIS